MKYDYAKIKELNIKDGRSLEWVMSHMGILGSRTSFSQHLKNRGIYFTRASVAVKHKEIVTLIAQGLNYKDVGARVGYTGVTISTYCQKHKIKRPVPVLEKPKSFSAREVIDAAILKLQRAYSAVYDRSVTRAPSMGLKKYSGVYIVEGRTVDEQELLSMASKL